MKREDPGTKTVVRNLCKSFVYTEAVHHESNTAMELHFSTIASGLSYRIGNARNTKYILTSSDGDVQTSILIGRPVKIINVTFKNLELCYENQR